MIMYLKLFAADGKQLFLLNLCFRMFFSSSPDPN